MLVEPPPAAGHARVDRGRAAAVAAAERAPKTDRDPKALACYGLLRGDTEAIWLRFVAGRPVSHVTTAYLAWVCERLAAEGKRALLLIWDNAS
jgi:DDE superfamily endonuclease